MSLPRSITLGCLVFIACVCELDERPRAAASAPVVAAPPAVAPSEPAAAVAAPPAQPAPTAAAEPTTFEALPRRAAQPDRVVLDDAGAAPRRTITWQLRRGQRERVELSLGLEVALSLGTRVVPPTAIPAITVALVGEVASIDDAGTTLALSVADVQVPTLEGAAATARVQQALTRVADELRTTAGTLVVASDGRLGRLELGADAGGGARELAPERGGLVAALQELLPVVPTEPVGIGARWTVTQRVRREGATLQQIRAHHLTSLDEHGATIEITTQHVAVTDDPAAATVALDRSTPMTIEAASGSGTVTLVLRDDHVLPLSATADLGGVTRAQVQLAGALESIAMRTQLHAALRSDDAPSQ